MWQKVRGIAKYSDVGHVENYISETVQDTPVQLMSNRKSYTWNVMVLLWTLWGDQRVMGPQFGETAYISEVIRTRKGRSNRTRR